MAAAQPAGVSVAGTPGNNKVLLMGRAGAGKTSMRSIIFANYLARETSRLHPTQQVEHSNLRFLGKLSLSLWDCGGQDVFMENYFESQRNHIFRNVVVLIYVLGIYGPSREGETQREQVKDYQYFKSACDSIRALSPNAKCFVLVHKLDLVPNPTRQRVYKEYETQIGQIAQGLNVRCFPTSIWDATLFKAWSTMVNTLIPNIDQLQQQLEAIAEICEADEVVLFELATFLVITSATRKSMHDLHRFEKVSNIIKQFKLSCGKCRANFKNLTVMNENFTAFLTSFTTNSFIMVITSDKDIQPAATLANLNNARERFKDLSEDGGPFGSHL
jgi:Ras-related GTP-binding protein A/B